MSRSSGQALIEVAAFFMALAILIGGLCGFTKWFAIRQKLLLAAKEGALLYSSGRWTRAESEARMRQMLTTGILPLEAGGVRVSLGPRPGVLSRVAGLDVCEAAYVPLRLSERLVVLHAPRYWGPLQPWAGPAVPYGS